MFKEDNSVKMLSLAQTYSLTPDLNIDLLDLLDMTEIDYNDYLYNTRRFDHYVINEQYMEELDFFQQQSFPYIGNAKFRGYTNLLLLKILQYFDLELQYRLGFFKEESLLDELEHQFKTDTNMLQYNLTFKQSLNKHIRSLDNVQDIFPFGTDM